MKKKQSIQHVQTLIDMNHCVGIARRDAAYQCMMDFTNSTANGLREESSSKRLEAYDRCAALLREAIQATLHASTGLEPHDIMDRPVVHILKLLNALMSTLRSLANHVYMVKGEADVLSEPLGEGAFSLLVSTCKDFEANERMARYSFCEMLNVGRQLLENSTQTHQKYFSEDEMRRYMIAHQEYVTVYSDMNYQFAQNLMRDEKH